MQDRAATSSLISVKSERIHLFRDLNILNWSCFPVHCRELAQASLLRDSSLINHSIWQEQVSTSWLVPSAHSQMRWGVFFHSSDVWLCERRCGCSGKICQPSSLRQKLLGWGSSSWLSPPGGQNLCEWPHKELWATFPQSFGKNHFSMMPLFERLSGELSLKHLDVFIHVCLFLCLFSIFHSVHFSPRMPVQGDQGRLLAGSTAWRGPAVENLHPHDPSEIALC